MITIEIKSKPGGATIWNKQISIKYTYFIAKTSSVSCTLIIISCVYFRLFFKCVFVGEIHYKWT